MSLLIVLSSAFGGFFCVHCCASQSPSRRRRSSSTSDTLAEAGRGQMPGKFLIGKALVLVGLNAAFAQGENISCYVCYDNFRQLRYWAKGSC